MIIDAKCMQNVNYMWQFLSLIHLLLCAPTDKLVPSCFPRLHAIRRVSVCVFAEHSHDKVRRKTRLTKPIGRNPLTFNIFTFQAARYTITRSAFLFRLQQCSSNNLSILRCASLNSISPVPHAYLLV